MGRSKRGSRADRRENQEPVENESIEDFFRGLLPDDLLDEEEDDEEQQEEEQEEQEEEQEEQEEQEQEEQEADNNSDENEEEYNNHTSSVEPVKPIVVQSETPATDKVIKPITPPPVAPPEPHPDYVPVSPWFVGACVCGVVAAVVVVAAIAVKLTNRE